MVLIALQISGFIAVRTSLVHDRMILQVCNCCCVTAATVPLISKDSSSIKSSIFPVKWLPLHDATYPSSLLTLLRQRETPTSCMTTLASCPLNPWPSANNYSTIWATSHIGSNFHWWHLSSDWCKIPILTLPHAITWLVHLSTKSNKNGCKQCPPC